jgi:hypothetical protein
VPTARPERTLIEAIPDVEDRELRISLIRYPDFPEWGEFREIAEYIPSRDLYGRGYVVPEKHASKVGTAMRKKPSV